MMVKCELHDTMEESVREAKEALKSFAVLINENHTAIKVIDNKLENIGTLVLDIQQRMRKNGHNSGTKKNGYWAVIASILIAGFVAIPTGMKIIDALLKAFAN